MNLDQLINTASLEDLHKFITTGDLESADQDIKQAIEKVQRINVSVPTVFLEESASSRACGSEETLEAIFDWAEHNGHELHLVRTGSLGYYSGQPVVGIQLPGRNRLYFERIQSYQVQNLFDAVWASYVPEESLLGQWGSDRGHMQWEGIPYLEEFSFFSGQVRRVMKLNGIIDPQNILEYISWGGYHSFAKSIQYYTHEEIVDFVEQANLRGRSGSGFPAHIKWQKAIQTNAQRRYVICNADESDPGGYMHRALIEGNPHQVLEGLMICAYAVGASEAFIYTRNRYTRVVDRLKKAIEEVRKAGLIGQDILNSGFSLDIKLRKGPGAYVCGEETALSASIEGKRGMPKPKPPFPAESGLFGHPTIVHNIETLAHIPLIVNMGPLWFKSKGTSQSPGTKLFSLSGKFKHQGVVELPFGYTLEELTYKNAQGIRNNKQAKCVLPGGPSGKFVIPEKFSLPLEFESYENANLKLGSGSMVMLDEDSCPVNLAGKLMTFMQQESCGKCIPCREGTKRMATVMNMIISKPEQEMEHDTLHRFKGVTQLNQMASVISETSLCGLGKGAPNPIISALENFRDEFEDHVFDRICPAGVCQELRSFYIDPEACTGCYLCFDKCPEQAIIGSPRQVHVIVDDRCTGCGKCQEVCKFNAVYVH